MTAASPRRLSARVQVCVSRRRFLSRFASAIILYSALGNEVATDLIFDDALAAGRADFLSASRLRENALSIGTSRKRARTLTPGAHGILEPQTSLRSRSHRCRHA